MPIYEYQCSQCGHQLEAFQNIKEKPLTECPICHQNTLNKLISAAGFQLKGSGWYATDYKPRPDKNSTEGSEKPKESQEKKTEKPAESNKSSDKTGSS